MVRAAAQRARSHAAPPAPAPERPDQSRLLDRVRRAPDRTPDVRERRRSIRTRGADRDRARPRAEVPRGRGLRVWRHELRACGARDRARHRALSVRSDRRALPQAARARGHRPRAHASDREPRVGLSDAIESVSAPAEDDRRGRLRIHPMLESTAGGFAATPRDLVRWGKALFEARALPRMRRRRCAPHRRDRRRAAYGLGLYRYETPVGRAWATAETFRAIARASCTSPTRRSPWPWRRTSTSAPTCTSWPSRSRSRSGANCSGRERPTSSRPRAAAARRPRRAVPSGRGRHVGGHRGGRARELGLRGRDSDPERGKARHHHLIQRHAEHAAVLGRAQLGADVRDRVGDRAEQLPLCTRCPRLTSPNSRPPRSARTQVDS